MAGVLQRETPVDLHRQDRKRDVKRATVPVLRMPALPWSNLSMKFWSEPLCLPKILHV